MTTRFRVYSYTLAAGEFLRPTLSGDYIRCTDAQTVFDVRPNGENTLQMQKGIGAGYDVPFTSLEIKNGPTPQTIELYVGSGRIDDNRLITQGGVSINANASGAYSVGSVGTSATLLLAQNNNRASALLQNLAGTNIYIGDASVTVATGMFLGSGGNMNITHKSAIYGVAASAVSGVRILEESN